MVVNKGAHYTGEDSPVLPDLVVDNPIGNEAKTPNSEVLHTYVTPTNITRSEFDFPALSSEEDNIESMVQNTVNIPIDTHDKESQLTEEEGDAVNALLSLSRSLPSNGEDAMDSFDNGELMPIGKTTLDVAPVSVTPSNLAGVQPEVTLTTSQTTTTTMTIITSKTGMILSTHNDDTPNTALLSSTSQMSPKLLDDPPGSPQGKLKLRSYRLKKKTLKTRNFLCKSCGASKKTARVK